MIGRLRLQDFALPDGGPGVTATFLGPEWIAVVGRAGAGKSGLLKIFADAKGGRGQIERTGDVLLLEERSFRRRQKVGSLLARGRSAGEVGIWSDALSALGLMEWRDHAVEELPVGLQVAAHLLPLWGIPVETVLIDGLLDHLDLWTLDAVLARLDLWRRKGTLVFVATHRERLFEQADSHIVVKNGQIRFAGRRQDLLALAESTTVRIVTRQGDAVRALVDPFVVEVQPTESGFLVRAQDGQDLAARLLREGYGPVDFVELNPPTVKQVLLQNF